jgi:hypothetical protein
MSGECHENVPPLIQEERELARKFLEIFSAPDFEPYKRRPALEDMGCFPYVDAVFEFMELLAHEKIGVGAVIDDPALRFYRDPELIPAASAEELRRMLYAMTRNERLCDGVFGSAIGTIAAALRRILEDEIKK